MAELVTNVVVEPHNMWTLTKHLAISLNRAAGKTDAEVYGTKTNVVVSVIPPPPKPHTAHEVFMGIGFLLLFVFIFVGLMSGAITKRDFIGL